MRRQPYFEISSASLSAMLLEVAYTRVLSFKVHYSFTYLIIGIALLGLGIGAALVAASKRLAERNPERLLPEACLLGAASVLAGYLVTAKVQLNASALERESIEVAKLCAICAVLALPFVFAGVVIGVVLGTRTEAAGKLYAAALGGTALGCGVATSLLQALDPPRVIMLCGAILTLPAILQLRHAKAKLVIASALSILLFASGTLVRWLPDALVDRAKGFEEFRKQGLIRETRPNPLYRVDVADHPVARGDLFVSFHDGLLRSSMRRRDSRAFDHLDQSSRSLPFVALQTPNPRVLVIGAGGDQEIQAALRFGAAHVTLVELNAATLSLLESVYADNTGRHHEDPKVTLVYGNARGFLERSSDEFDLIWMIAVPSYAALNAASSSSLILPESYLYTVETMNQVFRHLAQDGIVCAQLAEFDFDTKPNHTVRFLSTVRHFYDEEPIPDFKTRVMVATTQDLPPLVESTMVFSRSPLTDVQINQFVRHTEQRMPQGAVRYLPRYGPEANPVNEVIATPHDLLVEWYRGQPYEFRPVLDDSPYFWQLFDYDAGVAERALVSLIAVCTTVAVLFVLAPLLSIREKWRATSHKRALGGYFAAVGVGFAFVQASVIQRLSLLLDYPTRSLTVTLFGLLLSMAAGAVLSERFARSPHRASGLLLASLFALSSVWNVTLPRAVDAFVGSALPLRVCVALALVAPIGVCLGGFLPVGLSAIKASSQHRRELVAWAWAVHAFAAVVGAAAATILAMLVGFKFLLVGALVIYAAGVLALLRVPGADLPDTDRTLPPPLR